MKNKIKKANKAGLSVKEESAITPLLTLLEQNEKSGKTILERQYFPMLVNVYEACRKQGAGKLMSAADADGKVYSAALILKDNNCTYLFSGINDPHLKQFAGKPLLVKEGIQMARKYGCTHFDFLGSMSEPIESFNRGFSANPIPYLRIFRYSKLASVMKR